MCVCRKHTFYTNPWTWKDNRTVELVTRPVKRKDSRCGGGPRRSCWGRCCRGRPCSRRSWPTVWGSAGNCRVAPPRQKRPRCSTPPERRWKFPGSKRERPGHCHSKQRRGQQSNISNTRIMIYKGMFYKSKYSILAKNKSNLRAFRLLNYIN